MSRRLTLEESSEALLDGEVVAVPTETVYGLAANALSEKAVTKIFEIKERPRFNPLICHLPDSEAVFCYGEAREIHRRLARFWPGPLTLLLEHHGRIPAMVSAGLPQVGFRVPQHELCLRLLKHCGLPLAAPSANRSGRRSPTTAEMALADLNGRGIAGVLDGGPCSIGIESTVIRVMQEHIEILRPGGLSSEALLAAGFRLSSPELEPAGQPLAPGRLESHYAPAKPLVLILQERLPADWWQTAELQTVFARYKATPQTSCYLAFGPEDVAPVLGYSLNLSLSEDLSEAARNLFCLLDHKAARLLIAHLLDPRGLGRAINDRLRRAATEHIPLPGDL